MATVKNKGCKIGKSRITILTNTFYRTSELKKKEF